MKLYPVPGGTWVGTEADWKRNMKARGLDPKAFSGAREVPTAKADLMEFLNFFAVDVYRSGDGVAVTTMSIDKPDVAALQALHNPDPDAPQTNADQPAGAGADADTPSTPVMDPIIAANIKDRLRIALKAITEANTLVA